MPMWIAQAVNRSGIPMEEFSIQQLARSTILVPRTALPSGPCTASRIPARPSFIHRRPCNILNHLIARDRQTDAERLRHTEHEPIANLPVADRLAVLLPIRIQHAIVRSRAAIGICMAGGSRFSF
jgi:hypothetical protein